MDKVCKQYLLKKILIRIDFLQVQDVDIDNIVQKVRDYFFESEFKLYQNVVPLASMQTDNIITGVNSIDINQPVSAVSIINETVKEYQFQKNELVIKLSSRYLIIEENIGNNYKGSDTYEYIIEKLMDAVYKENSYVSLQRIGLRKFNSLVFKEIKNINKFFDSKIFNQSDTIEKYKSFGNILCDADSKLSIISEKKGCKANIVTDIQTGEYSSEISGETGQAIQAVLDIDIYKDDFEKTENMSDYIVKKYKLLNEELFEIYKSALTEEFYKALLDGTVQDSDILGGIFNVQD